MKILLSPDPAEGNPPAETPPPAPAPAAPPAAAVIVNTGQRSEREITLDAELAEERKSHARTAGEKTARENKINELEAENHVLKARAPKKDDKRSTLEKWFAGEEV